MLNLKEKFKKQNVQPYHLIFQNWEDIYASVTIDIPSLNIGIKKMNSNALKYYELLEIIRDLQRNISLKKQNLDKKTDSIRLKFRQFFILINAAISDMFVPKIKIKINDYSIK